MTMYAICYDLKTPGQDYGKLREAIKKIAGNGWWHYLDSTWLVSTSMSAQQISDTLRATMDQNDGLLVIRVTSEYNGWLPKEAWEWLHKYSPQ